MSRGRHTFVIAVVLVSRLFVATAPVAAQSTTKWTVEFHAGFGTSTNPTSGHSTGVPPAATLPISLMIPSTLAVSSWYFGDGARLINQLKPLAPRFAGITPLDSVFTQPGATWQGGGAFGARISRRLTDRLAAEFSVDATLGTLALNDTLVGAVEASRISFQDAFVNLFFPDSSSTATIVDEAGSHLIATGAMTVALVRSGRFVPYATIGAGVDSPSGESPRATLEGSYRLSAPGGSLHEIDHVTLRVESSRTAVIVFGGGFTWDVNRRSGIRVDLRFQAGPQSSRLLLDAAPEHDNSGLIAVIVTGLPQSLIFSSGQLPTNLSGPALDGFELFKSTGTRVSTTFTAGYFFRF